MTAELGIHQYEKRYKDSLARLDRRVRITQEISKVNGKFILDFNRRGIAKGLSFIRRTKIMICLSEMSFFFNKDFDTVTKDDIEQFLLHLELDFPKDTVKPDGTKYNKYKSKKYSEWTKQNYKILLRAFYKWLKGNDDEYPAEVRWIKCKMDKTKLRTYDASELMSWEDVEKLIAVSLHPRDKAFIAVHAESGCRIGETGTMQVKHVTFDEYGCLIQVDGKTGKRPIRLMFSSVYISQWLSIHPLRHDRNAPLWVELDSSELKNIGYTSFKKMIDRAVKKAGIQNKKFNTHSFRHASASYWADKLNEYQMNKRFGWANGSKMAGTYISMTDGRVDKTVLGHYGIDIKEEETRHIVETFSCPRCKKYNPKTNDTCFSCTFDFKIGKVSIEKNEKQAQILNMIFNNPEMKELIKKLSQDKEIQGRLQEIG